jgi:hypothetical protein
LTGLQACDIIDNVSGEPLSDISWNRNKIGTTVGGFKNQQNPPRFLVDKIP